MFVQQKMLNIAISVSIGTFNIVQCKKLQVFDVQFLTQAQCNKRASKRLRARPTIVLTLVYCLVDRPNTFFEVSP